MFRLVSLNLNGIRSAANKGFLEWAAQAGADCMGVQEVKAQAADLAAFLMVQIEGLRVSSRRGLPDAVQARTGKGERGSHDGTHDRTNSRAAASQWVGTTSRS